MSRPLLFALLCFLAMPACYCQKIEKYFDYKGHDTTAVNARFYSLIEHTDSGWRRRDYYLHNLSLEKEGLYTDSACQIASGWFRSWYPTRMLAAVGMYRNGQKQGVWLEYYSDGGLADSSSWDSGRPVGIGMSWYRNGWPKDSCHFAADGSGMELGWFSNGQPSVAGRYAAGRRKTGRWTYFNRNGEKSAFEVFDAQGRLLIKQYYNERGALSADTAGRDRVAQFPGGDKGWARYLERSIYFPERFVAAKGDVPVVIVAATVDEDGRVVDAEVSVPFYPAFDRIALDAVQRSPAWMPAVDHNRRVSSRIRETIVFTNNK